MDDATRTTHVPLRRRAGRGPASGRLRAVRLGGHGGRGRSAARPRSGAGAEVRPEHAAAARRRADPAGGELRDAEPVSGRDSIASSARRRRRTSPATLGRESAGSRSSSAPAPTISSCSARAPSWRRAARRRSSPPTYALYRIATLLAARMPSPATEADGASLIWRCNPDNPTGRRDAGGRARRARAAPSRGRGRRRRGLRRVRRRDRRPVARRVPQPDRAAHDVEGVRLRRAPGRVRGRSACDGRRAGGAARAGADLRARRPHRRCRASRPALRPRRRDRRARARPRRSRCGRASTRRRSAGNFVWIRSEDDLGARLEQQGIIVRRFPEGIRVTLRRPTENDLFLRALGAEPGPLPGREATLIRTSTETALRITLVARRQRPVARRDRDRVSRPPVDAARLPRGVRSRLRRRRRPRGRRAPHGRRRSRRVRQRRRSRRSERARGSRATARPSCRWTRPARWRRSTSSGGPHAEISLAFTGERVGGLALSLLPHALERFTMEAGCTVHVESTGADDHHVAEAAFKALGQALRQAVAAGDGGIRSTKGIA